MQLRFKPENAEPIYEALAEHQVSEKSWNLKELLAWLQVWARRFNEEFPLDIPAVSLCVDWLSSRRLGHFRHGHNGFGLWGEIAINRRYIDQQQPWEILGTLLHELLHAWQEVHGKPGKNNYHNKEFTSKARQYGLVISRRGHTQFEPDSPFFQLLRRRGVEAPKVPPVQYVVRGTSKLKKWSCQCNPPLNVRVAVAHFRAKCLWCGHEFRPAS